MHYIFFELYYFLPKQINPRKPRNKNLTSIKKSNRRKLLLTRKKIMGPVDAVIQEIIDEYGIQEDIPIESASNM